MVHAYHESLEGFNPLSIWHDGCGECESRGLNVPRSLGALDADNFRRAWKRSWEWNDDQEIGRISNAERPLLDMLYILQVALQRECRLPMGTLPTAHAVTAQAIYDAETALGRSHFETAS